MMHKYTTESKPYEKHSLPKLTTVQFILNYSKAFEVKKLKNKKISHVFASSRRMGGIQWFPLPRWSFSKLLDIWGWILAWFMKAFRSRMAGMPRRRTVFPWTKCFLVVCLPPGPFCSWTISVFPGLFPQGFLFKHKYVFWPFVPPGAFFL